MDPGITNLAAPQSDFSKQDLSEQSSSDNVDDILPNPQSETWPSPSIAASRDKLTDPDVCFEHDDVPLIPPGRYKLVCSQRLRGCACSSNHHGRRSYAYVGARARQQHELLQRQY